jgi:aerobic-type carbon monoxide dehydrogenase small subunit (CoxS/CutS family)
MNREIEVTINGKTYVETVELRLLLVDFLREKVGLTGTHVGCGFEGRCGACTIVYEGRAVKSCMMLAVQADGARILTIEGLAQDGELHPLQKAFRDKHALQCGFCTPGFLMTLYEYLKDPSPEEAAIRHAMTGVLCRCTGYVHIVEATKQAIADVSAMSGAERAKWFPL